MFYDPAWYQVEDSDEMLEYADALLWADAGTGKTVTAMEALRKGGFHKCIVICPKMALSMWKEELEKHMGSSLIREGQPYYAKVKHSATFKKGEGVGHADALITTFGINRTWMSAKVGARNSSGPQLYHVFTSGGKEGTPHYKDRKGEGAYKVALIIDESHYAKSQDAAQTRALFGPRIKPVPLCTQHYADSMWQLTGTPATRYFDDLWTQLRAARPEILQHYGVYEYNAFVHKFCRTEVVRDRGTRGAMRRVVCGNTNHALMEKMLADCRVIRRKLDDVVKDMPPITHRSIEVGYKNVPAGSGLRGMTDEQVLAQLNDEESELASIRRVLGLGKVKDTAEYLKEYGRKPVLLGFWHKDVGEAYKEALKDKYPNTVVVDGRTSTKDRDIIREHFNSGDIPVLLGQMQAMNTSWNLQDLCRHVIIAEELPSPAMLHQFYSRVYRRGQKNHVQVDHARSDHQLDLILRRIREGKRADNARVGI